MKLAWIIPLVILGWLGLQWMSSATTLRHSNDTSPVAILDAPEAPQAQESGAIRLAPSTSSDESRVALEERNASGAVPGDRSKEVLATEPLIAGKAIRVDGAPFADAELAYGEEGPSQTVERTDEDGAFRYRAGDKVRALEKSWALVGSRETPTLGEFVFAHTVRFAGQVVDASGTPLPQVMILDTGHTAQAGLDADAGWGLKWGAVNLPRKDGRFDVRQVATWPGRMIAEARRNAGARTLVLTRSEQLAPIEGIVVEADGTPVPGAVVQAWNGRSAQDGPTFSNVLILDGEVEHRRIMTDQEGRFTLPRSTIEPVQVRAATRQPLRMGEAASNGEPARVVWACWWLRLVNDAG